MNQPKSVYEALDVTNNPELSKFGARRIEALNAVAEDVMARGGGDVTEFMFAIHGLSPQQGSAWANDYEYYGEVGQRYDDKMFGKLFISSGIQPGNDRPTGESVYYLEERETAVGRHASSRLDYRVAAYHEYSKSRVSNYIGIVSVPNVLTIHQKIADITPDSEVVRTGYELRRFIRFVETNGAPLQFLFGIEPISKQHWELDILKALATYKNRAVDMEQVAVNAQGLTNARKAFEAFLLKEKQRPRLVTQNRRPHSKWAVSPYIVSK